MKEIKFRILIGEKFYYWGFIRDKNNLFFLEVPQDNYDPISLEEAQKRSQQFTGFYDKDGQEGFDYDIWEGPYGGIWIIQWDERNGQWYLKGHGNDNNGFPQINAPIRLLNGGVIIGAVEKNPELLVEKHG
jgi:hypothetical protein